MSTVPIRTATVGSLVVAVGDLLPDGRKVLEIEDGIPILSKKPKKEGEAVPTPEVDSKSRLKRIAIQKKDAPIVNTAAVAEKIAQATVIEGPQGPIKPPHKSEPQAAPELAKLLTLPAKPKAKAKAAPKPRLSEIIAAETHAGAHRAGEAPVKAPKVRKLAQPKAAKPKPTGKAFVGTREERNAKILALHKEDPKKWTVDTIKDHLGIPRSTVWRVVTGYIYQGPK